MHARMEINHDTWDNKDDRTTVFCNKTIEEISGFESRIRIRA